MKLDINDCARIHNALFLVEKQHEELLFKVREKGDDLAVAEIIQEISAINELRHKIIVIQGREIK